MNTMVYTHGIYAALGIAATIWVTWTLKRKGETFLARWLGGERPLAASWSHLLSVGVYLLHVGCLLLALRLGTAATNEVEAIELLGTKLGVVLLALAATHFIHVAAYWGLVRRLPQHK
jgi:hypothetical protein